MVYFQIKYKIFYEKNCVTRNCKKFVSLENYSKIIRNKFTLFL